MLIVDVAGVAVAVGLAGSAVAYAASKRSTRRRQQTVYSETHEGGVIAPPALHPRINREECICTGACIDACPEKDVLGWLRGRPQLINPSGCIGHGACLDACPVDAVELVIGSAERGVDLPVASSTFETSLPGVYVAGELSGMGLIHNAVEQGTQAMAAIARSLADEPDGGDPDLDDVVIVGAGPAGLGAALEAKRRGLRYRLLDKGRLGGAIRSYPRQKIVMTAPMRMPGYGAVKLRRTTKEALLEIIEEVFSGVGLEIEESCEVVSLAAEGGHLATATRDHTFRSRRVVLAMGRRGTPRRLGVPGEDLSKVTYELIEPEQYQGRRCAVVGGGDSALEAAAMLAELPDTEVSLFHRRAVFDRAKPANRKRLEALEQSGRLRVHRQAHLVRIEERVIRVASSAGEEEAIDNDYVFVSIGGTLPTEFLTRAGVEVARFFGEPLV